MAAKVTLMLKCQILQQGIKCLQFDTKKNQTLFLYSNFLRNSRGSRFCAISSWLLGVLTEPLNWASAFAVRSIVQEFCAGANLLSIQHSYVEPYQSANSASKIM